LKLNPSFEPLRRLVEACGATPAIWKSGAGEVFPLKIVPITIEITSLSDVEVDRETGLFLLDNRPVFLYIKGQRYPESVLIDNPGRGYKFHFSECSTIEKMKQEERFERYVLTHRSDGKFKVIFNDYSSGKDKEGEISLRVCQNCLSKINYKKFNEWEYAKKMEIVKGFFPGEFFETYSTCFSRLPARSGDLPGKEGYPDQWNEISLAIRESRGWRCQSCGIDCSAPGDRHFLHVHHRNGVRSDVRAENLVALCVACHGKQFGHGGMKINPASLERIEKLRQMEKIITSH
jgi:hypothetical protein